MSISTLNRAVAICCTVLIPILYSDIFDRNSHLLLYYLLPTLLFSYASVIFKPEWPLRGFVLAYIGLVTSPIVCELFVHLGLEGVIEADAVGSGVWVVIGHPVMSILLCFTGLIFGITSENSDD